MFNLPATPVPGPHKDSLCKLCYLQDGSIVSCSQDGVVCFWTLGLKPKRIRRVRIINYLMLDIFNIMFIHFLETLYSRRTRLCYMYGRAPCTQSLPFLCTMPEPPVLNHSLFFVQCWNPLYSITPFSLYNAGGLLVQAPVAFLIKFSFVS